MPPRKPGRPPSGSTRERERAPRAEERWVWPEAGAAMPEHVAVSVHALGACCGCDEAVDLLEALQPARTPWLLESSLVDGRLGRHSLLGVDPYAVVSVRGQCVELDVRRAVRPGWPIGCTVFEADPFEVVRRLWPRLEGALDTSHPRPHPSPELPFVGGAVAVFGYELAECIETLGLGSRDDLRTPDLVLLLVDRLVSIDHARNELTLSTLGFGSDAASAGRESEAALSEWRVTVEAARAGAPKPTHVNATTPAQAPVAGVADLRSGARRVPNVDADGLAGEAGELDADKDAAVDRGPGALEYARRVRSILADIERGNVYEVNLTQRMSEPFEAPPLALYRALRVESPAPFAAYLELPDVTVVGSSPERFLKLGADGHVESRPIKGTRPRGVTPDRDAALAEELVTSPKDRAENLMIVDLVRNDLGRVCELGSVRVPGLMQVEAYATVFQLVSTVVGRLRRDRDGVDLVRACFPPGSMTGAPKIAAMRIAGALEPVRRGIYSGALGYLDVRGGLDLSVVIRSWLVKDGRAHLHVGGAVVADSDPAAEYEETLDKARALRAALERTAR